MSNSNLEQRIALLESQIAELQTSLQPVSSADFNVTQGCNGFSLHNQPVLDYNYNNYTGQFSVRHYYDEDTSTTMALVCNGEKIYPLLDYAGSVYHNGTQKIGISPALFPLVDGFIYLHVYYSESQLCGELLWFDDSVSSDANNEYIEIAEIDTYYNNDTPLIFQSWWGGYVNIENRWL